MASNMVQGTTLQWYIQEAPKQPQDNLKCLPRLPRTLPKKPTTCFHSALVLVLLLLSFCVLACVASDCLVWKPHDISQTAQESPQDSPKSD